MDKAITVRSLNGAAVTTLDGAGGTRVIRIAHADAKVDSFTIKGGIGSSAEGYAGANTVGGGVLLVGGTLMNSSIVNNSATWGGGVFFVGNASVVSNCLVQGNSSNQHGGGLSNRNQTGGRIVNNTIRSNSGWGAGVWIEYATLENNVVAYNTDPANYSGGIRQWGGTNRNSLVYQNTTAAPTGAGIYVTNAGLVENNTVVYNSAATSGNNLYRSSGLRAGDASVIRNTIVCANPTFNPPAGTFTSAYGVKVSLATLTPGATIRYTTDGSDPSASVGTVYTGPLTITATMTLKAIAFKSGTNDSGVTSAIYTIGAPTKWSDFVE